MGTSRTRITLWLLIGLVAVGGGRWGRHAVLSDSKPVDVGAFRVYDGGTAYTDNAVEGSEPYLVLFGADNGRDSPLADAHRLAHLEPIEAEGTANGFQPGSTSGPRIDWIAVSRHWRVVEVRIDRTARDGRTPSDHFPVTAVLERSKGGQVESSQLQGTGN